MMKCFSIFSSRTKRKGESSPELHEQNPSMKPPTRLVNSSGSITSPILYNFVIISNNMIQQHLVAAVESNTIHPIGKAIREAAKVAKCPNVKADDGTYMEEPGSGAVASVGKKILSVGTLVWVRRHGVNENPFVEMEEFKNQSVVYVGIDGVLAGLIYVEDQIREDVAHVIQSLTSQIFNVYLLSGDKKKFSSICRINSWNPKTTDGKVLATAAAQLNIFSCSDRKKMQKFMGILKVSVLNRKRD
uniref:Uncharacterized protein n=1 Tax=Lactuca sativa TaxID=4236 RepID=A0A9R1V3S8_LACSA|nr:hypothetical protein LSAT_V11C600326090 [Lactuca sativa]